MPTLGQRHLSFYRCSPLSALCSLLLLLMLSSFCMFAADETGQPAPRFRTKTTSGSQFNHASVKGKVILFEFWTSWRKYCEEEASLVDDIAKEFSDRG
jgi:thiol-disulfide isomerase/thioredoxin